MDHTNNKAVLVSLLILVYIVDHHPIHHSIVLILMAKGPFEGLTRNFGKVVTEVASHFEDNDDHPPPYDNNGKPHIVKIHLEPKL